jgi:ABC-type glycerol-3-phosphate transport system substrate-binding protein
VIEWMVSNGVQMWDEAGNVLFNTPEAVEAVQWMLDFTNQINRGASTLNMFFRMVGNHEEAFLNERSAMSVCGPWLWYMSQQYLVNTGITLRPHNHKEYASTASAGWGYGIMHGSRNHEAAWEFVKWMTIEEAGGGWFTLAQSRPSAVMDFNRNPEYFSQNPYWPVIIQGFETSQPLYNAPATYEEVFKDLVKKVMAMEETPGEGVEEAARQLQRMFDAWR